MAVKLQATTAQTDKLMKGRCRLMTREPWYGHIAMNMTWIPSDQIQTMGVRIRNGADIQCLYSPAFVDSLNIKELFAVIQHEIEHIVRCHCIRTGHRNPEAWNIAADMCVNGKRTKPRIGYSEPSTNEVVVPLDGNIIWIPEDWPVDETSEFFYDKLEKNQKGKTCKQCGKSTSGKGQGSEGEGDDEGEGQGGGGGEKNDDKCPGCGQGQSDGYNFGGVSGGVIDDHSTWNQSDVSQDEARQLVKDVVSQATEKCQGHAPAHLEQAIAELQKPIIRWRELIRHYLGKHVGNSRKTHSRRNRRRRIFGNPGISRHAAATVCVVIDTSGSIGNRELEQFFAEIECLSSRAKITILQWDAAFQGYENYRRGDWKKLTVKGRGGTCMIAPMHWLMDNKCVPDCTVMLTDGYTGWADPNDINFPVITVITVPEGTVDGPDYGHVVRMAVNQ